VSLKSKIEDKYILCLCEGNAEKEIIEKLIDNELLIFKKPNLIDGRVFKRMRVRAVEERFLGYAYEKEVAILRIIDSNKEKFKLSKPYKGRFDIINIITKPEVEILIILDKGDYDDYCKYKTKEKPSTYCKKKYGLKHIKRRDFMRDYFFDIDRLLNSLKIYNSVKIHDNYCLYDLLEKNY